MTSKVLIVEDDPSTIELVRLYLQRDGYKVIAAMDGTEGLRLAREARPDLVVLDLMLPGMDGMQICQALREESTVPIVMLTARVEEEDRLAGLDMGPTTTSRSRSARGSSPPGSEPCSGALPATWSSRVLRSWITRRSASTSDRRRLTPRAKKCV